MKKVERPTTFIFNSFKWKINYIEKGNLDRELFGETFTDTQEIDIYTKNRNESVIRSTLLHELLHVGLEDVLSSIDMNKNVNDKEESLVRLVSPRLFSIFTDNPKLTKYLFN